MLDVSIFLQLERDRPAPGEARVIHNKLVFDALNAELRKMLPNRGRPALPPWSRHSGALQSRTLAAWRPPTQEEIRSRLVQAVTAWDSVGAAAPAAPAAPGDPDRVELMLRSVMRETEEEWTDYDADEQRVVAKVADLLLWDMLTDTVAAVQRVQGQRAAHRRG